jgi:hypothetical protein
VLIFKIHDPSHETEITLYKANTKKSRDKIHNHPKILKNSNKNIEDQIWYKK